MNLMNHLEEDRSWQDKANCLGVDPDLFFPERGASTREAKEVCRAASCASIAWNLPWSTARNSVSGAGSANVSAAGFVVSGPCHRAARSAHHRAWPMAARAPAFE